MNSAEKKLCKPDFAVFLIIIVAMTLAVLSPPAPAQEETLPEAEKEAEEALEEEALEEAEEDALVEAEEALEEEDVLIEEDDLATIEEVIVTGSRLKRDSFSSPSPMQIITGDISREAGLFDTAEILQSTSQVNSLQVNNSFNTFVLDNGLGAATIGYRGLGADRTLVLVNGRRLAPAGVGGAPSVADLNLIPTALIDRVENLFDGASSVYGSDAVAGVSNVILRSDVDGPELLISSAQPESTNLGGGGLNTP